MPAFDKDNQPYQGEHLEQFIQRACAVPFPDDKHLMRYTWPVIRRIFNPLVLDADNIPDRPCLFIGNHALFALDGMIMVPLMLGECNRFLRSMGDKFLWNRMTEGQLLDHGAVIGNPQVCSAMMEQGEDILVFPGGAHEAAKPTSNNYSLMWKERYGFVRLAAQHGYTLMPFATVGPEEFYGHLIEGEDLPDSVVGKLLKRAGVITENTRSDMLPPIPVGALGSLFPKPQRCYVKFGEPIDLSRYAGKVPAQRTQTKIRNEAAQQIERMICELLVLREQRKGEDGMLRRLLTF